MNQKSKKFRTLWVGEKLRKMNSPQPKSISDKKLSLDQLKSEVTDQVNKKLEKAALILSLWMNQKK